MHPTVCAYADGADDTGIEDFIGKYVDNRDVYFGVATRAETALKRPSYDAGAEDCIAFHVLFADIDFKNLDRSAVDALLAAMPLPPDIIVFTGGGYHCYWLLAAPIDAREAHAILRRLQTYVHSDNVADPPRILRVPGTINHKPERNKATVTIVKNGATARHGLAEFAF